MDYSSDPEQPSAEMVRRTYDRIGAHFAKTRPEPWDEVTRFLAGRTGAVGLDVGVGNGRHAELLADHVDRVIGIDVSSTLLETARARAEAKGFAVELCLADAVALPFRPSSVDLGVYIATLHHLNPRRRRIESLDELARVLGSDGVGLVSVWSVSHERFDRDKGFDTTVDWTLPSGEVVPRYYHIYDLDEFRADLETSRLRTIESFEAKGNGYAVVGGT